MGNCSGIFSSCEGKEGPGGTNSTAVRKIDREQLEKALNKNE
jgi:hypothetical protein